MIYFGITIGPIIETLDLTSSPAGLWCASYMFSDITYQICCELEKELGNDNLKIYSPYFPAEKNSCSCQNTTGSSVSGSQLESSSQMREKRLERVIPTGVGIYHDRIIFSCDEEFTVVDKSLENIIETVKNQVLTKLLDINGEEDESLAEILKGGLSDYLSIRYLSLEESSLKDKNILLTLNRYLDSIELNRSTSSRAKYGLKVYFENEVIDDGTENNEPDDGTENNELDDEMETNKDRSSGRGRNDRVKNC